MKKRNFISCNFRKPSNILRNILNSSRFAKFIFHNKIMLKWIFLLILLIYSNRNAKKLHSGSRIIYTLSNSINVLNQMQLELMT